jgi:hypothetical protein
MIKKALFITMALVLIIILVNRVEPTKSVSQNFNIVAGCHDFRYDFYVNVPAEVSFYVTKDNGIDPIGPFKVIESYQYDSTILHCGNDYRVTFTAAGFKTYEKDIFVNGFKPLTTEVDVITLEKL